MPQPQIPYLNCPGWDQHVYLDMNNKSSLDDQNVKLELKTTLLGTYIIIIPLYYTLPWSIKTSVKMT